jgi:hypothetical protein
MSAPYIPTRDSALDTFATNFSALITATPNIFGLVAADAVAIAAVRLTFHNAYLVATTLSTRTPSSIMAKDIAKTAMLATIRPYAQQIANNAAVLAANKIALGLNPHQNPPNPVVAPATFPLLTLAGAAPLQHFFKFKDSGALGLSKAKPAGAVALELHAATSATVVTDPTTLPFVQMFTKSPFIVIWGSTARALTAYYAGRWITRRGLTGPWSSITNQVVM